MLHRYSALDTSFRCLRKFYLDYVEKLPKPGSEPIEFAFGTGIHAALQASLEGDDALSTFDTYWGSLKLAVSDNEMRRHSDMAGEFIRKFLRLHLSKFRPAFIEQTLRCRLSGLEFEGTPDVLGELEGIPSVIDFKTSAYNYPKEKLLVGLQMPIYAEMASAALGYKAEQLVYYVFVKATSSIQVIKTPLTPEITKRAMEQAIVQAKKLEALERQGREGFSTNPTSCIMGKNLCSRFSNCYPEKLNDGQ